jgi:mono/diheme cytochrome c family protein
MSIFGALRDHPTVRQYEKSARERLPRWVMPVIITLVVLSWIPLVFIAKARVTKSAEPRIQFIPDMDNQPKYLTQAASPLFSDHRAMRPPVEGAVARGELNDDDLLIRGKVGGAWATTLPFPITMEIMHRGQERFNIFCSPCHGLAGMGDGMISRRAEALQEGKWVPPASLHSDLVRARAVGELFNTITNGIRTMPAYGPQIPVQDRWAIVAYVRALQRSQNATPADVPEGHRSDLR